MDEARAVLARLERIEALDREAVPAQALLSELRLLVAEAEAWVRWIVPARTRWTRYRAVRRRSRGG